MWAAVSSWTVVGIVVSILIGAGFSVMSITPPELQLAKGSFSAAAIILFVRVAAWLVSQEASLAHRALFAFLIFGSVGAGWVVAIGWINTRQVKVTQSLQPALGFKAEATITKAERAPQRQQATPLPGSRSFTNRTPRELFSLYEGPGRTILQADKLMEPYKDQWITVKGNLLQLIPDAQGVTAVLESDPTHRDLVNARFGKEWEKELSRINTGDEVQVRGQIGPVQNGQQLYLLECEYLAQFRGKSATEHLGTEEHSRRTNVLTRLRNEYIASHDGISAELLAGTAWPPLDWMNKRLKELGESWTVLPGRNPMELQFSEAK